MTLLTEYAEARDTDFRNRIIAALWSYATAYLQTNPDPAVAGVPRQLRLARQALDTSNDGMARVINALASAGLTNAGSSDAQIATAISTNWVALSLLFDDSV